ncbi:MAG: YWFCY domain-containing protein [Rudanella sp.]|nr:YWFCY domain-containing protein [Rudanella sp.]
MSTVGNDKEFQNMVATTVLFGWAILFFHLYIVNNAALSELGINLTLLNRFILALNKATHLFERQWVAKLAALFFVLLFTFGNKTKKDITMTWSRVYIHGAVGLILLFGNGLLLLLPGSKTVGLLYSVSCIAGYLFCMNSGAYANRMITVQLDDDPMNDNNESFEQESRLIEDEYSVNIQLAYRYRGKPRKGWVNVINPFRAGIVLGTPGSGKSFAVVNAYIRQHIEKGFTMYIYDFKFPTLSTIAYHYLVKNAAVYRKKWGVDCQFYLINFDDPRRSHRCNPLASNLMTDIIDAQESAQTIMLNLNKQWIKKQGDFFVDSPINFLAACIWFMKRYHDRIVNDAGVRADLGLTDEETINFCTFPHVIQFASRDYDEIFPILLSEPDLEELTQPFASALRKGALEQLEGQIASARIGLSKMVSPQLYWVMTGDDFDLTINDPKAPKILCVGNNPDRQKVYGAALGLYNARLVKLINREGRLPSSLIIDELPTIYFSGLDTLIATARSNKVSTCLGLQDLSQLRRDYGKEESDVIFNTIGNVFSGAVKGETAKNLSAYFGKNVQRSQSFNFTDRDTTSSISTRLDSLIPESKISNLSQGQFVGAVADNFGQEVKQKIFHGQLVVPADQIAELKRPTPIPELPQFEGISEQELQLKVKANFDRVKGDIAYLIETELNRIRTDTKLRPLLNGLTTKDPNYLLKVDED